MCNAINVWADGKLTHFSGSVSVQKANGKIIPAADGIKVFAGDTLITGTKGYVRVEMSDGSEMVLRPDSQLVVEGYRFDAAKPTEDNVTYNMLKGGLRTVTGLIGKRGNRDAYKLKTATAVAGIRGTQFDLRVCMGNCGALPDGSYFAVRYGSIYATNKKGGLLVEAGRVGFVPLMLPPIILPRDPGIGFTPPPVIPKLNEKKDRQPKPTAGTESVVASNPQSQSAPSTAQVKPGEIQEQENSSEHSGLREQGERTAPPTNDGPTCTIE